MKVLIVGSQLINYVDKKTGEPCSMIKLAGVRNDINSFGGKTVMEIFIVNKYQPSVYSGILNRYPDLNNFKDTLVNVDYDNNKQLCGFDILPKDDKNSAVVWGF